jgi:prepilin-type N-terminal cleavage/methylation domain-containing protein
VANTGYSLLEVLLAIAVVAIVSATALPLTFAGIDRTRAAGAARYVAGRLATARFEAVRRSAHVAIRFVEQGDSYWLQTFVDGNRNGVLASDIGSGTDRPLTPPERLDNQFTGVTFGILPGVTGISSGAFDTSDPIQIGGSTLLSFSPLGSCTSGTLFIRGTRGHQFAVRVLGATGRTRMLEYHFGSATWLAR